MFLFFDYYKPKQRWISESYNLVWWWNANRKGFSKKEANHPTSLTNFIKLKMPGDFPFQNSMNLLAIRRLSFCLMKWSILFGISEAEHVTDLFLCEWMWVRCLWAMGVLKHPLGGTKIGKWNSFSVTHRGQKRIPAFWRFSQICLYF